MKAFLKVVPIVATVALLGGCAPDALVLVDSRESPTVSATTDASPTPVGTEAPKEHRVFAADGKAVLFADNDVEGEEFVVRGGVRNLGKVAETYEVVLLTNEGVVDQKISVDVPVDAEVKFSIRTDNRFVNAVRLDGTILGEGIDQVEFAYDASE